MGKIIGTLAILAILSGCNKPAKHVDQPENCACNWVDINPVRSV